MVFETDIYGGVLRVDLSNRDSGRIEIESQGAVPLKPNEARAVAAELVRLANHAELFSTDTSIKIESEGMSFGLRLLPEV